MTSFVTRNKKPGRLGSLDQKFNFLMSEIQRDQDEDLFELLGSEPGASDLSLAKTSSILQAAKRANILQNPSNQLDATRQLKGFFRRYTRHKIESMVFKANAVYLTKKEKEVMSYMVQGFRNVEIAKKMENLSVRTVESHLNNIYTKFNLEKKDAHTSRIKIVNYFFDHMVDDSDSLPLDMVSLVRYRQFTNDLTRRQEEVLYCISEGLNSTETASDLHISVRTTESHRAEIQRKFRSVFGPSVSDKNLTVLMAAMARQYERVKISLNISEEPDANPDSGEIPPPVSEVA